MLADKIACEIPHMEAEMDMLRPVDVGPLQGYYFLMNWVNERTEDWSGVVILPDDREFKLHFLGETGRLKYEKNDAYAQFMQDATKSFPDDSCAVDTASAFLLVADALEWDDGKDY